MPRSIIFRIMPVAAGVVLAGTGAVATNPWILNAMESPNRPSLRGGDEAAPLAMQAESQPDFVDAKLVHSLARFMRRGERSTALEPKANFFRGDASSDQDGPVVLRERLEVEMARRPGAGFEIRRRADFDCDSLEPGDSSSDETLIIVLEGSLAWAERAALLGSIG